MANKEQDHSHRLDRREQYIKAFGPVLGFVIIFTAMAGGLYLVSSGKDLTGFGIFFTSLATLIGAYIYGKTQYAKSSTKDD